MTHQVNLGRRVITAAALRELVPMDVQAAMARHANGDWGEVCPEDHQSNKEAMRSGERLFSVYHDQHGTKFWIITEWDRSVTTILLPEDY
jgi:hypothetical protein